MASGVPSVMQSEAKAKSSRTVAYSEDKANCKTVVVTRTKDFLGLNDSADETHLLHSS